ncbi:hypothetical protein [Celeribacter litoreus]|uniref:hypothetical protein n=1 Tax=Celeribacter litoreus TaxID=2876714 RepID=UPI001CCD7BBA|nr:hypothetical protein [Celeribacter litoreus]MCA0043163.1 hypothetical protein [Celeribacter litoreus]
MQTNSFSYRGPILSAVAINIAVLVVFVVLAVLQFDQVRTGLEKERLTAVADRASEPLASAAMIGLDLASVRNLDSILERARQSDEAIMALHVLDRNGAIVKSTARSTISLETPEIQRYFEDAASGTSFQESGTFRYLRTFTRPSGDIVGALLMEYSGETARTAVWAMAGRLATAALGFCVLSSIFSMLAVRFVFDREKRIDDVFLSADAASMQQMWRDETTHEDRPTGDVEALMSAAEAEYHRLREARL